MDRIDIRDLRVDNLVYSSFSKTPCKVTETRLDESGYGVCKVTGVDGYKDVASLSPIPVTPEILEKNGFKVHKYTWEYRDNYCRVKVDIAPKIEIDGEILDEPPILLQVDGATFNLSIIIEYVHELQHALRLCGIEKEITI